MSELVFNTKCHSCFINLTDKVDKILINEQHIKICSSLINVELRLSSNSEDQVGKFICRECNIKLNKYSELAQALGTMQNAFYEYLNDNRNVEKKNTQRMTRKLVVSLERLDESTIEMYKNDLKTTRRCDNIELKRKTRKSIEKSTKSKVATKPKVTKSKSKSQSNDVEKFKCSMCDYVPAFRSNLREHIELKHKFEESPCHICSKVFDNKLKLKYHITRVHINDFKFKCPFCKSRYKIYYGFHIHMEKAHPSQRKKLQCTCDFCGEKYLSTLRLEHHLNDYHIGAFKCFDVKCIRSFTTPGTRKKHHFGVHSSDRKEFDMLQRSEGKLLPFKCLNLFCKKRFKFYDSMMLHYRMKENTIIPGKPCKDYKVHSKLIKDKPFSCDLCDYRSTTKIIINQHIESVHTFELSTCKKCNKVFKNAMCLKRHQRWHKDNLDKFECLICKSTFTRYQGLQTHVEDFHSTEKSRITHMCDLCEMTFYSIKHLRNHMQIQHAGPYGCFDKNCTRRFNNSNNRNEHFMFFHNRKSKELKLLVKKENERNLFP